MRIAGSVIMIGLLICAVVVFSGVLSFKAEAGDYYSPLYDFRLNQAAEGMGLLPEGTAMSGCNYGCMETERLVSPCYCNDAYGSTCPKPATCEYICDCACFGSALGGTTCTVPASTSSCNCASCKSTCYGATCTVPASTSSCNCAGFDNTCNEYTCFQTYDNTCYGITCSLTCCDNLCEITCSGTTCEYTCIGCTYDYTYPRGRTC